MADEHIWIQIPSLADLVAADRSCDSAAVVLERARQRRRQLLMSALVEITDAIASLSRLEQP